MRTKNSSRAPIVRRKTTITPQRTTHFKLCWPPSDEREQNRLGDQLVEWSILSESTKIEDFPLSRRMNPYRFKHIGDDNDYFKDCYEYAQYAIGSRLQEGIHTHSETIDRELGMRLLPLYNREYREMQIQLKTPANINQNAGTQYIVLEKMPSSPLVIERKNDEGRSTDTSE